MLTNRSGLRAIPRFVRFICYFLALYGEKMLCTFSVFLALYEEKMLCALISIF